MSRYQKVLWSEGLFLTPHHFQQWDRYYENLLDSRFRQLSSFNWGVADLEINSEALQNSRFELLKSRAVLPDGLLVDIPKVDAVPPGRDFAAAFSPATETLGV